MKSTAKIMKTSFIALFTLCIMAFMTMFSAKVNAAEAVTFTVNADKKLEANYTQKGSLDVVVQVLTATKILGVDNTSYTINKGFYYFDKNGICTCGTTKAAHVANLFYAGYNSSSPKNNIAVSDINVSQSGTTFTPDANSSLYTGVLSGKVYSEGNLYTGTYWKWSKQTLYYVNKGVIGSKVTGVMKNKSYYHDTRKQIEYIPNCYYKKGKKATAFIKKSLTYYENGSPSHFTGWKKFSKRVYYLKKGKAVTGYVKLYSYASYCAGIKDIKKAKKKGYKGYVYYFYTKGSKKGSLETNLIDNVIGWNKFIQKDIKIVTNAKKHNTTFYFKKKVNGKMEWVPAKTVICATARSDSSVPYGTHRLEKTWNKRWFVYTKTHGAPYRYYQWAVHIKGTSSLFHSSTYRHAKANTLRSDLYNRLGTSCTTFCIRHQARWAKLIYDIATKTNKKRRVPVVVIKVPREGPFGHVGLKKVSSGTKWDPTDPNK